MLHDVTTNNNAINNENKNENNNENDNNENNGNKNTIKFKQSIDNSSRVEYHKSIKEKEEEIRLQLNWDGRPDPSFTLWEYVNKDL